MPPGNDPLSRPSLNPLKLAPPADLGNSVERSIIAGTWTHSHAAVTLLCAPAGFGKTTAMRQLLNAARQQGLPAAWLNLDSADNDLGRLAYYLGAALQSVLPSLTNTASSDPWIDASRGLSGGSARQLLDVLSRTDAPFVLFVDEFEWIQDSSVLAVFSELAFSLAPGQRLVIGSRQKPALPLGRLRVQQRLLEIDAAMLRFNAGEARDYIIGCRGIGMTDADIGELQARTEGWPAALQLAASALAGLADSRAWLQQLSGASGNLAEYLAEDVLSRLSASHRHFVLRSSIFEAFCPQLCDAVAGRTDSADWIEQSIRANLFLLPIEAEGDWYRYHPLFRAFLRAQLSRTAAPELSGLHERAAHWLAATARYAQAIYHASAAGDTALTADLLERCGMDYVRGGQMTLVLKWAETLPQAELERRPTVLTATAYAMVFLHRYADAERLLVALARHPEGSHLEDVTVLRIMLWAWLDRLEDAVRAARAAVANDHLASPFVNGLLHNAIGYGDMLEGRFVPARHALLQARRELESVQALYGLTYTACIEGMIDMLQGNVRDALARFSGMLSRIVVAGQRYTSSSPVACTLLAEASYELGDTAAADALLTEYLPLIRDTCLPDHLIVAHRVASRIAWLSGDSHKAFEQLNALQSLGDARGIARLGMAAAIERSRLALLSGDVGNARHALELAESFSPSTGRFRGYADDLEDLEIARFRIALVAGDAGQEIVNIDTAMEQAERSGRLRRGARLAWLLSQAHQAGGSATEAQRWLERAILQGQAWQACRLFADEPWHLPALLGAHEHFAPAYLQHLRHAAQVQMRISVQAAAPGRSEQEGLLSPRELQILRRVADGHSNKALARLLFVSENTIETHLRRINGKLGTGNRMQAVSRARELGLM